MKLYADEPQGPYPNTEDGTGYLDKHWRTMIGGIDKHCVCGRIFGSHEEYDQHVEDATKIMGYAEPLDIVDFWFMHSDERPDTLLSTVEEVYWMFKGEKGREMEELAVQTLVNLLNKNEELEFFAKMVTGDEMAWRMRDTYDRELGKALCGRLGKPLLAKMFAENHRMMYK